MWVPYYVDVMGYDGWWTCRNTETEEDRGEYTFKSTCKSACSTLNLFAPPKAPAWFVPEKPKAKIVITIEIHG